MILLDPNARPVIAHRGASARFPENTLLAFDEAVKVGADALEFDVRLSSDGIPVVVHDATLDRTAHVTGLVGDRTAAELGALNTGAGQGIPTVEQILESFSKVPLLIELKEASAGRPLADILVRHAAAGRVVVGSFLHEALRCFDGGGFHRCASRRESAIFWLRSRLGMGGAVGRYDALSVPIKHRNLRVVDEAFMKLARRKELPVHVWTVDDPDSARRLRDLGIAGIITNSPERMVDIERS